MHATKRLRMQARDGSLARSFKRERLAPRVLNDVRKHPRLRVWEIPQR
jgi:hypothetical protein